MHENGYRKRVFGLWVSVLGKWVSADCISLFPISIKSNHLQENSNRIFLQDMLKEYFYSFECELPAYLHHHIGKRRTDSQKFIKFGKVLDGIFFPVEEHSRTSAINLGRYQRTHLALILAPKLKMPHEVFRKIP